MAQVKFYSKSELPTGAEANGIYFIDGGELYKGTQRFGLGRVTVVANEAGLSSIENPARGDIAATAGGAAWVYAGSESGKGWRVIGGDTSSLQSLWRADIKSWTSGLVQNGEGSYITGITQAADGKVTASASNFATDVRAAVGDGSASGSGNGITVSVTTTSGAVTGVEVAADNITCNSVTASSASFTDLTVTSTATFSATKVSAGTLTVDDTAVDNVSAASATGSDAGVAVTVSTLGGGVSEVGVTVTSATLLGELALTDFAGKSVVTTLGTASTATNDNIATEKAVREALGAFDNAMHFIGVVTSLPASAKSGDIVVIGGLTPEQEEAGTLKNGQEYIYDGTKWEKIGDQSAVTGGSSTSTLNGVSVEVVTAAATAAPTVTLTGVGTAAAKDAADAVTANAATLPTCSAVAGYVSTQLSYVHGSETVTAQATTLDAAMHAVAGAVDNLIANKASAGTATAEAVAGIGGTVTFASNAAPTFTMTVDTTTLKTSLGLGTAASKGFANVVTSNGTDLPTQSAVYTFVTDLISGLDSTVTSASGNVGVTVTQENGVLTSCAVTFEWL